MQQVFVYILVTSFRILAASFRLPRGPPLGNSSGEESGGAGYSELRHLTVDRFLLFIFLILAQTKTREPPHLPNTPDDQHIRRQHHAEIGTQDTTRESNLFERVIPSSEVGRRENIGCGLLSVEYFGGGVGCRVEVETFGQTEPCCSSLVICQKTGRLLTDF